MALQIAILYKQSSFKAFKQRKGHSPVNTIARDTSGNKVGILKDWVFSKYFLLTKICMAVYYVHTLHTGANNVKSSNQISTAKCLT